jgi:phage terminase large subunit
VKYSYKVDRVTGDILPTIIDANNHYIDALRYALQPMIKRLGKPKMARVIGA